MHDEKAFAAQVGLIVRDYLARQLEPVLARLAELEARAAPERGEPGPRGEAGERGLDGAPGERGAPGAPGRDGAPGAPGERGAEGARGAQGERGEVGPRGGDGAQGRDGMQGRDGSAGRDGRDGSDGKNGADGFGFDDLSVEYDGERTLTLRFARGERVREFPVVVPWPLDRGVWREGATHARGDGVTHGGSWWIAQRDTQAKPGIEGADWRLATKKGRDGRDGERGEKGDTGQPGRAGRDLTNLGPDGSKWA